MSEQQKEQISLSAEQQQRYDRDVEELTKLGEEAGIPHLEGRVKFGLDPAAMMILPETRLYTDAMADKLGVDREIIFNLIKELHQKGPWEFAERLKDASEPEIQAYIALASFCHEKGWPGYDPAEYLEDRKRVVKDLSTYEPEHLDQYIADIDARIEGFEDASEGGARIAIVSSDAALPLAMRGYKGCVVRAGEMRFVQTTNIPDSLLETKGLVKGFGELFDPELNGFKRVPAETDGARIVWVDRTDASKDLNEMTPRVKRIAGGFVLAYADEGLALELAKGAVKD